MPNAHDLTGQWDGTYRYADDVGPVTPFVANLTEGGTRFSGEVIEPHAYRLAMAHATIEGVRSGRTIEFTKTYRDAGPEYDAPIDYSGRLSENGNAITGIWTVIEINGTFEMYREEAETLSERMEASESVRT